MATRRTARATASGRTVRSQISSLPTRSSLLTRECIDFARQTSPAGRTPPTASLTPAKPRSSHTSAPHRSRSTGSASPRGTPSRPRRAGPGSCRRRAAAGHRVPGRGVGPQLRRRRAWAGWRAHEGGQGPHEGGRVRGRRGEGGAGEWGAGRAGVGRCCQRGWSARRRVGGTDAVEGRGFQMQRRQTLASALLPDLDERSRMSRAASFFERNIALQLLVVRDWKSARKVDAAGKGATGERPRWGKRDEGRLLRRVQPRRRRREGKAGIEVRLPNSTCTALTRESREEAGIEGRWRRRHKVAGEGVCALGGKVRARREDPPSLGSSTPPSSCTSPARSPCGRGATRWSSDRGSRLRSEGSVRGGAQ